MYFRLDQIERARLLFSLVGGPVQEHLVLELHHGLLKLCLSINPFFFSVPKSLPKFAQRNIASPLRFSDLLWVVEFAQTSSLVGQLLNEGPEAVLRFKGVIRVLMLCLCRCCSGLRSRLASRTHHTARSEELNCYRKQGMLEARFSIILRRFCN